MEKLSTNQLLSHISHRPFKLQDRNWLLYQEWEHVLFVHAPVHLSTIEQCIPADLSPDAFDGSAWITLVLFSTKNSRLRGKSFLPVCPAFDELNVRTYVVHQNKPGIYFIDIRSDNRLSTMLLRLFSSLRYQQVKIVREDGYCYCEFKDDREADMKIMYHTTSTISHKSPLENWLAERYCCYTVERNKLYSYDIHHLPWKLNWVSIDDVHAFYRAPGWQLTQTDFSLAHYAESQQVLLWRRQLLAKHVNMPRER